MSVWNKRKEIRDIQAIAKRIIEANGKDIKFNSSEFEYSGDIAIYSGEKCVYIGSISNALKQGYTRNAIKFMFSENARMKEERAALVGVTKASVAIKLD